MIALLRFVLGKVFGRSPKASDVDVDDVVEQYSEQDDTLAFAGSKWFTCVGFTGFNGVPHQLRGQNMRRVRVTDLIVMATVVFDTEIF